MRLQKERIDILETVRTLLIASLVPPKFWCDAAQIVVYLINRLPSIVLGKTTPYEVLFGHTPSYSHLRVLVACVLFIFHLLSALSYHHRLPNAFFLTTIMNTKVFYVMISSKNACTYLIM